jgi:hypothetical protein
MTGYRFLRLTVNETLESADKRGRVVLNEVAWFEGAVRLLRHPSAPLTGADSPRPFHASCTSEGSPAFPCWKALDRDEGPTSRWESADVGRKGWYLQAPQSLTLDLGPDVRVLPTAVSLVCEPTAQDGPGGWRACPRAFQVLGSDDGRVFHLLHARSLLTYTDFPTDRPAVFAFAYQVQHMPHGCTYTHACLCVLPSLTAAAALARLYCPGAGGAPAGGAVRQLRSGPEVRVPVLQRGPDLRQRLLRGRGALLHAPLPPGHLPPTRPAAQHVRGLPGGALRRQGGLGAHQPRLQRALSRRVLVSGSMWSCWLS